MAKRNDRTADNTAANNDPFGESEQGCQGDCDFVPKLILFSCFSRPFASEWLNGFNRDSGILFLRVD